MSTVVTNAAEPTMETRSHERSSTTKAAKPSVFPDIPVRTGFQTFNMDIIEGLVLAESVYKVEARKARELLVMWANKVFKQKWVVAPEKSNEQEDMSGTKKRKKVENLDYQLPDRVTVAKYLSDFSLLSFKHMAQSIVDAKSENKTVTYGTDDTKKAAGRKLHDVKTTHITITNDQRERETFTSGFYANASHTGSYAAETVKHGIEKMAVLTNNTYRDILAMLNFFMTDRASDSDVMLDELGIEEERRLKCNAHILLAIDVALDKVYRDIETQLGIANLIGRGASHVFNSPKNSIWYLGLLAVAKLLSPSHGVENISLYRNYTDYLGKLNDD